SVPDKTACLKERQSVAIPKTSSMDGRPSIKPEPPHFRSDIEWFWFKPAHKYIDALYSSKKRIRTGILVINHIM
ncbi:hypothetical protein PMAYCL1PPCAC_29943, partial [Pristionchus mayeri]